MDQQELADHLEIRTLVARGTRAIDQPDPEAFAALFTPDAEFESPSRTLQGHEALKKLALAAGGTSVHTTTDSIIEVEGDRASHRCTVVVYSRAPAGTPREAKLVTTYTDELTRTPGGWRIANRKIRPIYDVPAA